MPTKEFKLDRTNIRQFNSNYSQFHEDDYGKVHNKVMTIYTAHFVQIGKLDIYFSFQEPVGICHPTVGKLACDNFWNRITAHHLNRINRNTDKRISQKDLDRLIKECLKIEVNKW